MTKPDMFYVHAAIWSQVAAAILFLIVLGWLWFRFIQPAVLAAQENANKNIAEAERHRDEAKATLDLLKNEIDGAVHDADLIAKRAASQATREYESTVGEARESGERALQNARGELDRARASSRDRLRIDLLEKALVRARVDATSRVDAALDARLIDRFSASLGLRHPGSGNN